MRRRTARISESPRNAPSIMWAPQDDGATPLAKAQPTLSLPVLNPKAHPEEDLRVAEIAGMESVSVSSIPQAIRRMKLHAGSAKFNDRCKSCPAYLF
jgi:hypothetical protein